MAGPKTASAVMARRRKIFGDRAFRRLLKNMDEGVRAEAAKRLQELGDRMLPVIRGLAPRRTGATREALSMRVYPRSLRLRVGLIGKPLNRRLFYAHIVEFGRKASTVTVRRRTPGGGRTSYTIRVKAMPARHFVYGPTTDLRKAFERDFRGYWENVLQKAAAGVSDD
jgi:hypothetical protein